MSKKTTDKKAPAKKAAKQIEVDELPAIDAKLEVVEKENKEDGVKMMLAVQKGAASSLAVVDGVSDLIQNHVGKCFTSSSTGLLIKEGKKPTQSDFAQAISYLGSTSSNLSKADACVGWMLGDAIRLADGVNPDWAVQAIAESGRDKHTARQYERLCEFLPHEKRQAGLPISHHMAVFDYSKKKGADGKPLTKSQLFKALEWALKGEKVVSATSPDGKKMDVWKPKTRNELRQHLNELLGVVPEDEEKEDKEPAEEKKSKGFLYTDVSEVETFIYPTLSMKALESGNFIIFDLTTNQVVDVNGRSTPKDLPEDMCDEAEAPKKKSKKAKKEEAPPAEDSDEDDLP